MESDTDSDKDKWITNAIRDDNFEAQHFDPATVVNTETERWNYNFIKGCMYPTQKKNIPDGKHVIDGDIAYYKDGWLHRDKGPAFIEKEGFKTWYQNGLVDRKNGPAFISLIDDTFGYFRQGIPHRRNGPAISVINDVDIEEWWVNGQRHRIDGPAHIGIEVMYFIRGQFLGCDDDGRNAMWDVMTKKEKSKLSVIMHVLGHDQI